MSRLILTIAGLLTYMSLGAQAYYSRTGHVHVESRNKLKNIEADNYQIVSTLDLETGVTKFSGLLRSFEFRLGALDRVFNSRDLNVSQYPKIVFEGKVKNFKSIPVNKPGKYKARVSGYLYIWDETRFTEATGTLEVLDNGNIRAVSHFVMTIEDGSVRKLNRLMEQKIPRAFNVNTSTLGVSKDILIDLNLTYKKRR